MRRSCSEGFASVTTRRLSLECALVGSNSRSNEMSSRITRRKLLAKSTQAATALTIGGYWPRTALADRRKIGANERVVIALIGTGSRGTEDCKEACRGENV